ncbi:MAG: hypothetical protein OXQ31_04620 [Spirochaetaceae bacterium]|nr:hypothetical protein [Spirochaetaceae bacterium]
MPFKADASFLRFLSMGATGVRRTMETLRDGGFEPIELERYCGSNKIWSTKIKRLRVPDLLCVNTGLRVEVRAKKELKIRMSDTPSNPDRVWDAGLRDEDLVAFVACSFQDGRAVAADEPVFLTVAALRRSAKSSTLGPPKSASEGAERDRTWPATVPSRDGRVLEVDTDRITVEMHADAARPARRQTYRLKGRNSYVRVGDTFKARTTMIAGVPPSLANLYSPAKWQYDPLPALGSKSDVDRYAAVRALAHRPDLGPRRTAALENVTHDEGDDRVVLEAAGVAASLGSSHGETCLSRFIWNNDDRPELRMEAAFILAELGHAPFAHEHLTRIARSGRFRDDELRQAAVWGLGKSGLRRYDDLLSFIDDPDDDVALHAIAGFDRQTPTATVKRLVDDLASGGDRRRAAASAALVAIGSDEVITTLATAARTTPDDWILATLGRMPPARVRRLLAGDHLLTRISPMLLTADGANWLATEGKRADLAFLFAQDIA